MRSVLCFGEALIDFQPVLQVGPASPPTFLQHAGGAPANTAVAVACLGGRAGFLGMLGTDAFGDFLLHSLQAKGVDTRHAQRTHAAPTALAIVSLDASGERSFSFYRSPAADLLFDADALAADAFADAAVLHACSNSLTEAASAQTTLTCMQRARDARVLVSFDMNLRPLLWPRIADAASRIADALALADLVKLSVEELAFLVQQCGDEATLLARLFEHRAELVVVTDGARPLRWFTRNAGGRVQPPIVQCVDSTAAGDAFSGGLLFALAAAGVTTDSLPDLLAGRPQVVDLLRFACACGALATTRRGAFTAMPGRAEVTALLEQTVPAAAVVGSPTGERSCASAQMPES